MSESVAQNVAMRIMLANDDGMAGAHSNRSKGTRAFLAFSARITLVGDRADHKGPSYMTPVSAVGKVNGFAHRMLTTLLASTG